jgi:hypothetical protein
MEDTYQGFKVGQMVIAILKLLREKGIVSEEEALDLLWDAKDPLYPWSKKEIKELLKL